MGTREKLIESDMNTMSYKGYLGSIEASMEDHCLHGRVLALPKDTMITYEGETLSELEEDFHGAVDDYLAFCKAEGIAPRKSYSGALNVRISPDTHQRIAELASQKGVSINAVIKETLDARVAMIGKIL